MRNARRVFGVFGIDNVATWKKESNVKSERSDVCACVCSYVTVAYLVLAVEMYTNVYIKCTCIRRVFASHRCNID